MSGSRIGEVTHYYDRIGVAIIKLSADLSKDDLVHFLGYGSDFTQQISSMQIEHENILSANKGDEVAVKVIKPVKQKTAVFHIDSET